MTLYPNERTQCVHCHRRIRYVEAPLGGAWQHIATISIYCDLGGALGGFRAEPSAIAPR